MHPGAPQRSVDQPVFDMNRAATGASATGMRCMRVVALCRPVVGLVCGACARVLLELRFTCHFLMFGRMQLIKDTMDKKFGPAWQVVVGKGFSYDVQHEVRTCTVANFVGR